MVNRMDYNFCCNSSGSSPAFEFVLSICLKTLSILDAISIHRFHSFRCSNGILAAWNPHADGALMVGQTVGQTVGQIACVIAVLIEMNRFYS